VVSCYIQSHCFQPKGALVRKPVTGAIVMLEINGRKGFGTLQAQAFSEDKNLRRNASAPG
ncbi:hypothetical protein, partial [Pseudomonas viridiflava]|uniref:hypothetical protein n=1 Tax=Pseudomonas viridiflava TaxID=33069 RepID=UPI0019822D9A